MKPHQVREMVNELRDAAVRFRDVQQLRERISHIVHKHLAEPQSDLDMLGMLFEENQRLLAEISQLKKQEQPNKNNKINIVIRKPMTWVDDDGNIWRNVSHDTPLWPEPPPQERIVFPTSLRKMWSGTDVQQWLDENVNGEGYGN